MNTKDIIKIAKGDPVMRDTFLGVFPADAVMNILPKFPSNLIINTDPHDEPGQHWVAFNFTRDGTGEFFDSYGKPPGYYHKCWEKWMNNSTLTWVYNSRPIQPLISASCGIHCLFFIFHRCAGMPMEDVMDMYTKNKFANDRLAEKDLEAHTRRKITINDEEFVFNQICITMQHVLETI